MNLETSVSRRRLPWPAFLALGAGMVIAAGVAKPVYREVRTVYYRMTDPRPGQDAPRLSLLDTRGERVQFPPPDHAGASVLLFLGECTNCAAKTLRKWETVRKQGHRIYAVTQSDRVAAQAFLQEKRLNIPLLLESTPSSAVQQYNPVFRPRAYVVDGAGKFLYIQPDTDGYLTAVKKASGLLHQATDRKAVAQAGQQRAAGSLRRGQPRSGNDASWPGS